MLLIRPGIRAECEDPRFMRDQSLPQPGGSAATRVGSQAALLDRDRLRATLRLLTPPTVADRIVAEAGVVATGSHLRDVTMSTIRAMRIQRVKALFRRGTLRAALPWLAIGHGAAARARVVLALHVGGDLDGDQLANVLGITSDQLGLDLAAARQTLAPATATACARQRTLVVRYSDRRLEHEDRVTLLTHTRSCEECRAALSAAEELDARLPVRLPAPRNPVARALPRLATAILALLLVGLVVATAFAVERFVMARHTAVPLVARPSTAATTGWLLAVTPLGGLQATNLETGEVRSLKDDDKTVRYASAIGSPSGTFIAIWQQPLDDSAAYVYILRPTGEQLRRLSWTESNVQRAPTGWLNDDTLLLLRYPPFVDGELPNSAQERIRRDTQLIAVDVGDGSERVIFQGDVSVAQASPDGRWVALRSSFDEQWYGSTLELRPLNGNQLGQPTVRIEHRAGWGGVWSSDSAHYYTGVIVDREVVPRPPQQSGSNPDVDYVPFQQMALQDIRPNGATETLTLASGRAAIAALVAAPDGQTLLYTQASTDCCGAPNSYWRIAATGGSPEPYPISEGAQQQGTPLNLPNGGGALLSVWQPHYLNPVAGPANISGFDSTNMLTMRQVVVFDGGPTPRVLVTGVADVGSQCVGWLPADGFGASPHAAAIDGNTTAAEPVSELDANLRLTKSSSASPDGETIILTDTDRNGPMLWYVDKQRYRPAPRIVRDLTWADSGASVISAKGLEPTGGNWLSYTIARVDSPSGYGSTLVDPVTTHDSADQHYAHPTVSHSATTPPTSSSTTTAARLNCTSWARRHARASSRTGRRPPTRCLIRRCSRSGQPTTR